MPALSQNLTFTVNTSTNTSVIYPNTGTSALIYNGNPVKGDGYFGRSDGLHSVQIKITNFIGRIEIQGSLSTSPGNNDWFNANLDSTRTYVDTTGLVREESFSFVNYTTATSTIIAFNIRGNFVWLRARLSNFTQGTLDYIKYNY